MSRFLLHHTHTARECPAAFAAWKGFASPLRKRTTIASCHSGGHEMWWELEAPGEAEALRRLPPYLAERTRAVRIADVLIP